jgi:signal transduction histidine kinase
MIHDNIIESPFKPRARMLLQLGDQLIKNESIALVELVKNAYDADASYADISMENIHNREEARIIIKDDGCGMDKETILNVWLEPGSDSKSQIIETNRRSPKGRLPIGEKGIGRFGVHKLGNEIEMITKKKDSSEIYVQINWNLFTKNKYLSDIPISVIERRTPIDFSENESGTIIIIKKMRKDWTRGDIRNIKRTINALSSPFESNDSFSTKFKVPGHEEWLSGMIDWKDVKQYALYYFKATLADDSLSTLTYKFMPWDSMNKLSPFDVEWNKGMEIDNTAINEKLKQRLKLIETFKNLTDRDDAEFSLSENDIKIGVISFEGYIFDRDPFILKLGVSDKQGFKEYLNTNGGVRVYRDNLRVYDYGETGTDWLNLDIRRVNQPGKRFSNNILLSAISLNREVSTSLIEKTNREGFIEDKAFELFRNAILNVVGLVETLRMEDKKTIRELYGPTPKSEPVLQLVGDLKKFVDEKINEEPIKKHINQYLVKIENDYQIVCSNLLKAAGAGLNMSVVLHEVEKIAYEVATVLKAEKVSDRAIKLVEHLSSLIDGYAEIIRRSEQKRCDIKLIINNALFNTEYRLKAHNVTVNNAYQEYKGNTTYNVSRSLITGAMMNLIDNSIYWLEKRMPNEKKIYIGLEENDSYLNMIIADNGTGFLLPTDSITEPFVSAKPDGIGLGLHIASEVMSAQKGFISFPDYNDVEIPEDYKYGAIIMLSIKK